MYSKDFFENLIQHVMAGSMLPKMQLERAIGPIIGLFIAEVLSKKLGGEIKMLCPEFPIRKSRLADASLGENGGNFHSTNVDWLMWDKHREQLILVELKTCKASFRDKQLQIYQAFSQLITEKSAEFLLDDLLAIAEASQQKSKYKNMHELLEKNLISDSKRELPSFLSEINSARIVYIAPKSSKPRNWKENENIKWLNFSDLPVVIDHCFSSKWSVLHKSLVSYEALTESQSDQVSLKILSRRNFQDSVELDKVLKICDTHRSGVVVGVMGWAKLMKANGDVSILAKRLYKWDWAQNGQGVKLAVNWMPGDQFLEFARSAEKTNMSHTPSGV